MRDLSRLLRPRSIAVIGGGAWCANVVRECLKAGFAGEVWPVHPKRQSVGGVPAVASLEALPGVPDAAFIGVNRHSTVGIVETLSSMGAGGAICFASGFREVEDGVALEAALVDAAGDMPVLGPNCYGLINYLDGALLWPDQHGGARETGGIALVAQSSNILLNLTMQQRGLPVAYAVAAGNQAQTSAAEIGMALLADPRVTALGLYLEGIGDLREFEALASVARDTGKPIVALKVGRSAQARAATVSHTASLAGEDAGADALFRRLGVARVDTLPQLLETLKLLHAFGPLSSNRIASLSCSGGEASLIADAALAHGVEFPALDERQNWAVAEALGPMIAPANPLDYHTFVWADTKAMTRAFTAMMDAEEPLALGLLVLDLPRADRCDPGDWDAAILATRETMAATGVPMALVASLPENMPEDVSRKLHTLGLVSLGGLDDALAAVSAAAWLGRSSETPAPLLLSGDEAATRTLDEAEAKAALAGHGVEIPVSRRAGDPAEAARMAEEIGFPVALKGEGVAHKTEAGAVVLGLETPRAVADAATRMPCERYLIEEMVSGAVAELLVGVVRDPAHGYLLTLAPGGTLAELLDGAVSLLLPVTEAQVGAALDGARWSALLRGWRGGATADRAAILRAVLAVQSYVIATAPALAEVEINPLLCCPDRAVAADALARITTS